MRYSLIQAIDKYSELDKVSKRKIILEISADDDDVFVQARAGMAIAL